MKYVSKFSCSNCEQLMIKSNYSIQNKLEYLIFCKNYDSTTLETHLKLPTDIITEFIILSQNILAKILERKPHRKKISQFAGEKNTNLIHVLNIDEACILHKDYLIKHLIICKLFKNFNWFSKI